MKIFLTGATGFIGRVLLKFLTERGHEILTLRRNSDSLVELQGLEFVGGDLSDIKDFTNSVAAFKPDVAVHAAWEGIPNFSIDLCLKNLSEGTQLFKTLGMIGCKKIIGIGSCWEYGNLTGRVSEDAISRITHPMPAAKAALHIFGREIARAQGVSFLWTRPFFVYGPGQKSSSLIPTIIKSLLNHTEPEIKNINDSQDYIYIDDLAEALCMLIEKKMTQDEYSVYNIGSGTLTSVAEILRIVYHEFGRENIPRSAQANSLTGLHANILKIQTELNWYPKVTIKEGIQRMVGDQVGNL